MTKPVNVAVAAALAVLIIVPGFGRSFPSGIEINDKGLSSQLFEAIDAGDAERVSELLKKGVGPDVRNERGMPPLVFLFSKTPYRGSPEARLEIARLLLSHGADPNASANEYGAMVLDWAIMSRAIEVVRLFLQYGVNLNIGGSKGHFPSGHYLFTAVHIDERDIVELLIAHGQDVNARDQSAQTPLFHARSLAVAKALVDHGADVNADDYEGMSVLDRLSNPYDGCDRAGNCMPVNEELISYLRSKGATSKYDIDSELLIQAVKRSDLKQVQDLLDKGANVNGEDREGRTALDFAAEDGNLEVVSLLLERGANINAEGQYGGTALDPASASGNPEVVKLLLKKGANIKARSHSGATPLISPATIGDLEMVKLLLEKGVDINAKMYDGDTALMRATFFNHPEIVKVLLEKGADVNAKRNDGQTVLSIARMFHRNEIIEILKAYGAKE